MRNLQSLYDSCLLLLQEDQKNIERFAGALFAIKNVNSDSDDRNITCFYRFLNEGHLPGFEFLLKAFELFPVLGGMITREALCTRRPASAAATETGLAVSDDNKSALSLLIDRAEGCRLLEGVLKHHPGVVQFIDAETLCALRFDGYSSALFSFTRTPKAMELFQKILAHNPALAGGITAEALCACKSGSFKLENALSFLLGNVGLGHPILLALLRQNSTLVDGLARCLFPGFQITPALISILEKLRLDASTQESAREILLELKKNSRLQEFIRSFSVASPAALFQSASPSAAAPAASSSGAAPTTVATCKK